MKKTFKKSVHFKHDMIVYVPYFLTEDKGSFTYNFEMATHDEQMAWSFEPFGVFELKGTFDAVCPPILDYLTEHGNGD